LDVFLVRLVVEGDVEQPAWVRVVWVRIVFLFKKDLFNLRGFRVGRFGADLIWGVFSR